MSLRLAETGREAEVRLVGEMGERAGRHVYGVEFTDDLLDFWQIAFPPPEPPPLSSESRKPLECSICGAQESCSESEIEADVFAVSQAVLRLCAHCGVTTRWREAGTVRRGAALPTSTGGRRPSPGLLGLLGLNLRSRVYLRLRSGVALSRPLGRAKLHGMRDSMFCRIPSLPVRIRRLRRLTAVHSTPTYSKAAIPCNRLPQLGHLQLAPTQEQLGRK